MSLETFDITLRITLDSNHTACTPAEWDWYELLDLGPTEEVGVVNQTGVTNNGQD